MQVEIKIWLNGQVANLSLKGSPHWLAPELLQSEMQKDTSIDLALAVDIWSLGCTVIEMMTGKPPWSEYEGAAALFKVLMETPPIPKALSADGKDFLNCCFRRNPAERPTAIKLLDHPFVNYSQQPDGCTQPLKELRLTGLLHKTRRSRREAGEQALLLSLPSLELRPDKAHYSTKLYRTGYGISNMEKWVTTAFYFLFSSVAFPLRSQVPDCRDPPHLLFLVSSGSWSLLFFLVKDDTLRKLQFWKSS
ncbi:UNVERIFIED_CONTAM: Mitogen-activated protein kinase kinase kinase [Sesamum radiatum]|uniref:Mitogen-activated protein kinase kinase kinase n=1 Tax=Sesamum radiatum TaxID=300843 RepID=A0AAW2V6M8_SESRA